MVKRLQSASDASPLISGDACRGRELQRPLLPPLLPPADLQGGWPCDAGLPPGHGGGGHQGGPPGGAHRPNSPGARPRQARPRYQGGLHQ